MSPWKLKKKINSENKSYANEINTIINNGVDGVESDIAASAMKVICDDKMLMPKPLKLTTGNWSFEHENLASTGVGSQFRPLDYSSTDRSQMLEFGTTASFGIKPVKAKIASIAKIPAFNPNDNSDTSDRLIVYE